MNYPRQFVDQMHRSFGLNQRPLRIVSLVPSQTELLYHLGLDAEVVGQTLFCIHPAEQHLVKPRVGGTKKLDINKIRNLKPDLIIGNKEENKQSEIVELMQEFPVWMSDIKNLEDALEMILSIGNLVGKPERAKEIHQQISAGFEALVQTEKKETCVYLIWRNPWMAAGGYTFIDDMLSRCGYINLAKGELSRYPELQAEWLLAQQPANIFLSSEPYPFKEKHLAELQAICVSARIKLVDGELFSWYGNRLIASAKYFKSL
ncbi:MAG: helical backbone metal receptor [bacterium]|nr:helical backbone metal receptor [bacterium]